MKEKIMRRLCGVASFDRQEGNGRGRIQHCELLPNPAEVSKGVFIPGYGIRWLF